MLVLLLLGLLAPVVYSYASTMARPSSLPLSVRTVEWIRSHHGAWLVDTAERYWYSWHTPKKGGPTLRRLPTVGLRLARTTVAPRSPHAARPYRPPRIQPVLHPPLPGEGVWRRVGPDVRGAPPLLVTTFRSDRDYPRVVAYVAWIDHTRTRLGLYPGRYEPPGASPRGPMEVPPGERRRLVATFNSGFTYGDGHGGFVVDGRTAEPLRSGDGTVVAYRDGHVNIVSWNGGGQPGPSVVLARQNLPLIVVRGRPSPLLDSRRNWGNTLGDAVRVWRSGLGIDRRGNLIYLAADLQTVKTLAAALARAGAVRAIELDINPEWPTFVAYSGWGARGPLKVVPNGQQPATRYLVPDDRDFFAVYRTNGRLPATVPFR